LGVTKPGWGTKRNCGSCGKRFYDLKHNPIICPQCGAAVTVRELPTKTPKATVSTVEAKPEIPAIVAKPTKIKGDDAAEEDDDDIDGDEAENLLDDASDLDEEEDTLDVVKTQVNDAGND
jgi:uncharacterized protein (TIGR02300 family)